MERYASLVLRLIEPVNVANYYSYESLLAIVHLVHTWREREETSTSCRNTQIFAQSLLVLGGRTLFLWNFKRTIGVRAEEFLTLRELPWQQWQAVINPRRERWRMVERGEEEEETRTDRRTDGPTDSPSLSSAASDPLIFCPYLFSLVTSSPVADPFALHREKMREFVSLPLRRFAMRKRRGFPGN